MRGKKKMETFFFFFLSFGPIILKDDYDHLCLSVFFVVLDLLYLLPSCLPLVWIAGRGGEVKGHSFGGFIRDTINNTEECKD